MLDEPAEHFNFGYNNPPPPDPSVPIGAYGCEMLITVGSEVEPEGEVKIKQIPGGLYAVARCKGTDNIYPTWSYLFHEWLKSNGRYGLDEENEPGLEELLNVSEERPERWVFDLYLPVKPMRRTPQSRPVYAGPLVRTYTRNHSSRRFEFGCTHQRGPTTDNRLLRQWLLEITYCVLVHELPKA